MTLENAADPTRGPGPWFVAHSPGACSRCGDLIEPGDTIRADGWGSWECCDEDDGGPYGADLEDALRAREEDRDIEWRRTL